MTDLRRWTLACLVGVSSLFAPGIPRTHAIALAVNCDAVTLRLTPGVHPGSQPFDEKVPPDAPHRAIAVMLPLYPDAVPLQPPLGSPYAEVIGSPYVQTASAQYRSASTGPAIRVWYRRVMPGCGWRNSGSWSGNAGTYPNGLTFDISNRGDFEIEVGIRQEGAGQTDFALAAEEVVYPAPPPQARLHGPFVQLRIAATQQIREGLTWSPPHTTHVTVLDRGAITRVVRAINHIHAYFSVPTFCPGGPIQTQGPVRFSLIRADGSTVHGFENLPGPCGGLSVNHVHWLLDPGTVWEQLFRLTSGRG